MRRTELKRTTPLRSTKPMARGTVSLRHRKPKADKPKRAAREVQDKHLADMCHGAGCYLLLPTIACSGIHTTVPAHSNQAKHGKGMGIKAHHEFTVPGCGACHAELDQGKRFTREEKAQFWDEAYARWVPVRERLLETRGN